MSRASRKSELSPSITKSANGIDLGKRDVEVDMGQKSVPSVTSGGIGVSQEVTNIGGVSVTGDVSVDISPLGGAIIYDPSENEVSIAASAKIPGGILGASGGVSVDINTGQIVGGSIGGEAGGFGVSVSVSKGGAGIEISLQIPGTPIQISLGLRSTTPTPEPTPEPTPTPKPRPGVGNRSEELPPGILQDNCLYSFVYFQHPPGATTTFDRDLTFIGSHPTYELGEWASQGNIVQVEASQRGSYSPAFIEWHDEPITSARAGYKINSNKGFALIRGPGINSPGTIEGPTTVKTYINGGGSSGMFIDTGAGIKHWMKIWVASGSAWDFSLVKVWCPGDKPNPPPVAITPIGSGGGGGGGGGTGTDTPPFPNPPPRKRNMDECCRESTKLLRLLVRHTGAGKVSGQETLPEGVSQVGSNQEGIQQAYPFKVKKSWLDPNAKEGETIEILNDRQLTLVLGGMIERLEKVLGTAEFYKDSDKKLRQSEGNMLSWLTGKNKDFNYPDPNDFWFNSDDGIIKEQLLEVRSIADGLRYQIEALNRLERILPIAELKDSSIPARWIYPNGKGQLRVGNLIHLCEYMIRKSDKDMGYWPQKITIKAANPAIKDDKAITTDVHSQADMLRVILQQILDVEGDGDMGSNYDLRRTYLDVMAFQMLAKNNKYLQAITEYLSFDMIEEVSKIPIPFDPFAGKDRSMIEEWWIKYGFGEAKTTFPTQNTETEIEQLSEGVLQNSELEVNTIKFGSVDAKRDPKTLKESLIEILKHSSASAAAVTEVASESALDRVVDAAGIAQKLTSFLLRRDIRESFGIGDLDNWIASAEKGYTDNLESESLRFPESSSAEPYGRPTTQNPVIREIDTKEDKAD